MTPDAVLRTVALCVVLAGAETLHGIARTVWVVPRISKDRAQQLGIVTGTALAFGLCFVLVPDIGLRGPGPHLALGVVLAAFMASFDLALGHWLLRRPWSKALRDLDPRTGNLLLFGVIALVFVPTLVAALRGLS